jgi:hypothetical protein
VSRLGVPAIALAAVVGLVAGCGGGSGSAGVASVASSTTTAPTTTQGNAGAAPTRAEEQAAALKYSQCMRSHGEPNFPDPLASGAFRIQAGTGVDPFSPAFKTARTKCQKFLLAAGLGLGPGSGPPPSAQALAHMVKIAQCMRRHGIAGFPDPRTSVPADPFHGGTGEISDIEGVILIFPSTIDTGSPAFTRAAAACNFPLHNH